MLTPSSPGVYHIKEMHLTLQGEGANTGLVVVLLRFSGCNLSCSFCDTDFEGTSGENGGVFGSAGELADAIQRLWSHASSVVNVLCTGGEPLMQMDENLIQQFHERGFRILLETNGSIQAPESIDWICVSPKSGVIKQNHGDEIKVLVPFEGVTPADFEDCNFTHFYLQPVYDSNYKSNLEDAIEYCKKHPKWRLSLQTHRYTGIK